MVEGLPYHRLAMMAFECEEQFLVMGHQFGAKRFTIEGYFHGAAFLIKRKYTRIQDTLPHLRQGSPMAGFDGTRVGILFAKLQVKISLDWSYPADLFRQLVFNGRQQGVYQVDVSVAKQGYAFHHSGINQVVRNQAELWEHRGGFVVHG